METQIIKQSKLKENDYGDTKVTDIINQKNWPFSLAIIRKIGDDVKTGHDTESDVVYYVLEGQGYSMRNEEKTLVKKGDCIVMPKGTKYRNLKGLTLLAIAAPRFNRNKRVYID